MDRLGRAGGTASAGEVCTSRRRRVDRRSVDDEGRMPEPPRSRGDDDDGTHRQRQDEEEEWEQVLSSFGSLNVA